MLARVSMYAVRRAPSCAKLTRAAHAMVVLSAENALDDIAGDSGRSRMMEELEEIESGRRISGVYIPRGGSWCKHVDISTCTFSVKESSTVFESENSQPVLCVATLKGPRILGASSTQRTFKISSRHQRQFLGGRT